MHQLGLLKAIKYFGSQQKLAEKIGVSSQCIANWLNRDKSIPFESAVKIAIASQDNISLCELVPQKSWLIHYIRRAPHTLLQVEIQTIKTDQTLTKNLDLLEPLIEAILHGQKQRPIAITPEYQLLFGLRRFVAYQALHQTPIAVQVIHLPDLLQPTQSLTNINTQYALSERVSLAHQLEIYIHLARQQIKLARKNREPSTASYLSLQGILSQTQRTDDIVSQLLQLGGRSTYRTLKQIVQQAPPDLITALDAKQISVHQALQSLEKNHCKTRKVHK